MKKIITSILVICLLAISIISTKYLAAAQSFTVEIENGASMRLDSPTGLRFKGTVSGDVVGSDIKYGIVIANGDVASVKVKVGNQNTVYGEVDELNSDGTFSVSMVNIPTRAFTSLMTVRAYVKVNGVYYYSSNTLSRNIYEVALKAKADGITGDYIDYVLNNCYNVEYNLNGGNFLYAEHTELVNDFLADFAAVTSTNITADQVYEKRGLVKTFFTDNSMFNKWGWMIQLFYDLGEQGIGYATSSQAQYTEYLNGNAATASSAWAVAENIQGLLTLTKCTGYSQSTGIDFSDSTINQKIFEYLNKKYQSVILGLGASLTSDIYKSGYTFDGWYIDSSKVENVSGDLTLYAKWKTVDTTESQEVKYILNGGTWKDTLMVKNNLSLLANIGTGNITKYIDAYFTSYEGNVFIAPIASATNPQYSNRIVLKDLDGIYQIVQIIKSGDATLYDTTADYAIYWNTSADYKMPTNLEIGNIVTFNQSLDTLVNGNIDLDCTFYSESNYNLAYTMDTTVTPSFPYSLNTNINNVDYTFGGWYLTSDFTGDAVTSVTAGTTVYAKWETTLPSFNPEWAADLENLFASLVEQDIVLPTTYEEFDLVWNSSNETLLSNQGKYTRPYQASQITMSVDLVYNNNILSTATFDVSIAGFADLSNTFAGGFIYSNYTSLSDEVFTNLDVLYCAFLPMSANGSLTTGTFTSNLSKYVVEQAHAKGKWVVVSVGGGDSSNAEKFATIAASASLRSTLATNIVNVINQYNLDGVDIDWETPSSSQATNFTLLMEEIYTKVKTNNPNHLVTADIGGGSSQPACYDLLNSQNYLDYINVMTYGLAAAYGYHQSALYASTTYQPYNEYNNYYGKSSTASNSGLKYTLKNCSVDESVNIFHNTYQVAYNKLVIGAAFYAVKQSTYTDTSSNKVYFAKESTSNGYGDILTAIASGNYDEYFDDECKVPYLLAKDKKSFYSYDNPTSIGYKCEYAKNKKLAGVFHWASKWDKDDVLVKALGSNLK